MQAFEKLTHLVDGEPRIISDPPLIVPIDRAPPGADGAGARSGTRCATSSAPTGGRWRPTAATCSRSSGSSTSRARSSAVGSVGTRAWIALLPRRRRSRPAVSAGQGGAAVGAGAVRRQERVHELRPAGRRRATADAGDERHLPRLAAHRAPGSTARNATSTSASSRTGRARSPIEAALPQGAAAYGKACAWTLARAHARSGDRIAIACYLGKTDTFDRAIADFAELYADQNERDYGAQRGRRLRPRQGRNGPLTLSGAPTGQALAAHALRAARPP